MPQLGESANAELVPATTVAQNPAMRLLLLPLLLTVASLSPGAPHEEQYGARAGSFAQLSDSIPRLFLEVVNDSIRGRIDPAKIRFSPPASLSMQDIRLLDAQGEVVATVDQAEINVAVRPLLSGDLVITRLLISGPRIDLHLGKDGTLNLVDALSLRAEQTQKKKEEASRFQMRIDEL
ncbi:MAG: AsmA family protein, partial [Myxococcota bacterium]